MGKLPVFTAKRVVAVLETHGFTFVRRKGSHIVMQRKGGDTTRTVIVPDHKTIRLGTLHSIIRQSGLSREVFEDQ